MMSTSATKHDAADGVHEKTAAMNKIMTPDDGATSSSSTASSASSSDPATASVQMLNPFVHKLELVTSWDKIKVKRERGAGEMEWGSVTE